MNFLSNYLKIRNFFIHRLGSKLIPLIPWFFFRWPLPSAVVIEPTNFCNLRCPICPTHTTMKRKRGMMKLNRYKKIINEMKSHLKFVAFNFAGEPTLNKDLFKMVRYAEDRGIRTYISTNTTLLDHYLSEVFSSKLSSITVCLDGVTKKSHETYRRGSDFQKVKENIRKLCQMKRKLKAKTPYIEMQFLVMKHNEREIPQVIKLARRLGVDAIALKTISLGSSISLEEQIRRGKIFLPIKKGHSRYTLTKGNLKVKLQPKLCDWVKRTVIYWNGDVTTCCYDFFSKHKVGNIFEYGSFKKLWFSDAYAKMRKKILMADLPLCKTCARTADYGCFLTKEQLRKQ